MLALANTLDEDAYAFRGASAELPQISHGRLRHISTSNSVFAEHVPTPAYLSIKPSQRTPIPYSKMYACNLSNMQFYAINNYFLKAMMIPENGWYEEMIA